MSVVNNNDEDRITISVIEKLFECLEKRRYCVKKKEYSSNMSLEI